MPVPLLDLKRQYEPLSDELESAALTVLRSGGYIGGPAVERFEARLAAFCGAEHAIAVGSGSDALLASLMALDIGPGDEVITTPFTFFATAGAIARVGATPVFADIDPVTFNLDPRKVAEAVTDRTKAIMPVDLYGQPADYPSLQPLACDRDLPLVEDAAQAVGATLNGRRAGAFGLIGCLSFYPTKNLSAAGDAGAILTSHGELAHKLTVLRNHGMEPRYHYPMIGGNFRLDALQCALLAVKLDHIDRWNARRRELATRYARLFEQAGLAGHVTLPVDRTGGSAWHQYVIRTDRRDELAEHLRANGIGCAIFYPLCLHQQACFAPLGYRTGDLPEAERAASEVLALPMFPELTEAEQDEVVATIAACLGPSRP
ncbi:MAG: aminotransferase class I/II-fold pyridoxal phosphate-dependent enzyme [Alphaproteobacteria bacterium]|jgi:dTDP-4-amino-4,6-dideoxygalactose transaminase|nr:aminotransferase class I/II-fold pyridoxal phosphate-dependent enzyme [Alphaproteobacteria bacterium]